MIWNTKRGVCQASRPWLSLGLWIHYQVKIQSQSTVRKLLQLNFSSFQWLGQKDNTQNMATTSLWPFPQYIHDLIIFLPSGRLKLNVLFRTVKRSSLTKSDPVFQLLILLCRWDQHIGRLHFCSFNFTLLLFNYFLLSLPWAAYFTRKKLSNITPSIT